MNLNLSILFLGLMVQLIVLTGVRFAFIRRLKLVDPETWRALGEPNFVPIGGSLASACRLLGYLARREYRSFQDRQLARRAALFSVCLAVYVSYFIMFLVLALVGSWQHHGA